MCGLYPDSRGLGMNKQVGGNDEEDIPSERPGILGGLAARLQGRVPGHDRGPPPSRAQRLAGLSSRPPTRRHPERRHSTA